MQTQSRSYNIRVRITAKNDSDMQIGEMLSHLSTNNRLVLLLVSNILMTS